MNILQFLGLGRKKLISQQTSVQGTVTHVQKCWWIKINTKPVRSHALDGAVFPHIVTYEYGVSGKSYCGRQMISAYARCPHVGESVQVFLDPAHPENSTIDL